MFNNNNNNNNNNNIIIIIINLKRERKSFETWEWRSERWKSNYCYLHKKKYLVCVLKSKNIKIYSCVCHF